MTNRIVGRKEAAVRKAKSQASEKACFGKFQPDGLKQSEILGEENVKACNNNGIAIDKNTPSYSTPQTRLKLETFSMTWADMQLRLDQFQLLHQHYFMISATAHRALLINTLKNCHIQRAHNCQSITATQAQERHLENLRRLLCS
ncbi:hypothetical protein AVEN_229114-1 [Araneus ventricosus]|uniref:Uncharacterized protein n=1 Tax=Araneus ventricosus TaxID=182803 RepID=A0A4Y2FPB2_ARAVE|nr:hypothetical protein AVEN_229114-1 [Araneus ventricosus]